MLFVLHLIEFTSTADGERETSYSETELMKIFRLPSAIFIPIIPSRPLALKSIQLLNIAC